VPNPGLKHSIVGQPLALQRIRDIRKDSISSIYMPFSSAIAYLTSVLDMLLGISARSILQADFLLTSQFCFRHTYERLVRTIPGYSLNKSGLP
jgi:hypothetical protein